VEIVTDMIDKIRKNGDQAIYQYEQKFSNNKLTNLLVKKSEYQTIEQLSQAQKCAIKFAYNNIRQFALLQKPRDIILKNKDKKLTRIFKPITNVGIYVPGGSAPLVSTLLMTGTLAKIAGCKNIIVCTPVNKKQRIDPAILYAAKLIGINRIYKIGGVQAICAMGFGLVNIPQVNKIFGPGNQYVAEAKRQICQIVKGLAIDLPAGPSEVMIIADDSANPKFTAADLLAQAEHIGGRAILLTPSVQLGNVIIKMIEQQKQQLSKQSQNFINQNYIDIIIVNNISSAFNIANQYAPEHLMLQIINSQS
jgi:histidinol dehydrogenase